MTQVPLTHFESMASFVQCHPHALWYRPFIPVSSMCRGHHKSYQTNIKRCIHHFKTDIINNMDHMSYQRNNFLQFQHKSIVIFLLYVRWRYHRRWGWWHGFGRRSYKMFQARRQRDDATVLPDVLPWLACWRWLLHQLSREQLCRTDRPLPRR